jgi:perosamine synthetase
VLSVFPKLKANFSKLEEKVALEVLRNGLTIFSNKVVKQFEEYFARYVGVRFAISTSSGTSALTIALQALKKLNPQITEVIIPAYSYIALVNATIYAELKYTLVDNDSDSLSTSQEAISSLCRSNNITTLPYIFGIFPPPQQILNVINERRSFLVEDCALGLGMRSKDQNSWRAGSFGTGCFSFAEPKTMTTCGEGGMITTNDEYLRRICRAISHQGIVWKYSEEPPIDAERSATLFQIQNRFDCFFAGQSSRMTAMQAAIGIVQLEKLDTLNRTRWRNVQILFKALQDLRQFFSFPFYPDCENPYFSANHMPIIIANDFPVSRDVFVECLRAEGIPATIYSSRPLFEYTLVQRTSKNSGKSKHFPNASKISKKHVLLPIYKGLSKKHLNEESIAIHKVVEALLDKRVARFATAEANKRLDVRNIEMR